MAPVRSPLGAIGFLLVALEAIFGGALFALDADPWLRLAMVTTMIVIFVPVAIVVLWMVVYLTVKNPGFLFNPAEVAQLSESVQRGVYAMPDSNVSLSAQPLNIPSAAVILTPQPPMAADADTSRDDESLHP